jgi:hypothetical protein
MTLQISQILYTFVLRAEIATFSAQMWQIFPHAIQKDTKFAGYIFRILQHFPTKLCNCY